MNEPTSNVDPQHKGRTMYEEADIGSGEKSPGQHETEQMIREIPTLPPSDETSTSEREGDQEEKEKRQAERS